MEWNEAYRNSMREMTAAGSIRLATGVVRELTGDDVVRFSASVGSDALLPGSVLSRSFELELANETGAWLPGGEKAGLSGLAGTEVYLSLGIRTSDGWQYQSVGAFRVERADADEGSGIMTLRGNDCVSRAFAGAFVDGLTYPARLGDIWRHLTEQAGCACDAEIPNGSAVIGRKPEWGNVTLRRAASFIAAAAGGFVSADEDGVIRLQRCRSDAAGMLEIGPDEYLEQHAGGNSFGPVEAIEVEPVSDGEDKQRKTYQTGDGVIPGLRNTLTLSDNPLFMAGDENLDALCRGLLDSVAGFSTRDMRFLFRGNPGVGIGSPVAVTDRRGNRTVGVISGVTQRFDRGYEVECRCDVPDGSNGGVARAITESGLLNGEALTGTVDGGLLRVGSVSADAIAAGSITAEKIATHALDAEVVRAVSAEIEKIVAGELTTDRLYATMGELIALYADTAGIDYADIKDLVAGSAIITEGVAGKLYISRLAVTEGNIASLTVGELVVKGADGRLFSVGVDEKGAVVTREKKIENANVDDHSIVAGEKLVEGSITAACLNVSEIFADSALIRVIKAANIDVADLFAAEATVNQLRAMTVSSIDNGSTLYLGKNSVRITTPEFSVRIPSGAQDDGDALRIDEDGVTAQTMSVSGEFNCDGVAKRFAKGGSTFAVTSFSEIVPLLTDRVLDRDIVINCNSATKVWPDVVTLRGVHGAGSITINGNGVQLSGRFTVQSCDVKITVNRLYANYVQDRSPYLTLNDCATSSSITVTDKAAYKATTVSTYRTAGTRFYGSNDYFYQGATYTYAKLYGYLWCSGAKALAGKNIRKASLKVRRVAGIGGGTAAKITLFTSPKTGPSGDGTTGLTRLGDIGSIYDGEEKTFDIPVAAAQTLIGGGAIVFYTEEVQPSQSGGLSGRYAKFYGVGDYTPEITITYDSTTTKPGNSHEVTDGGFGQYLIKAGLPIGDGSGVTPVLYGGTGADNATDARTNLGITPENIGAIKSGPGASIPSGADLNSYTTPGVYRSSSGTVSATLVNTPYTTTGFRLEVFNTTSANQIMQEIKANSASARTYRRAGSLSGGVWTFQSWYQVVQAAPGLVPVNKAGDTMTGALVVPYLMINTDDAWAGIDISYKNGYHRCAYLCMEDNRALIRQMLTSDPNAQELYFLPPPDTPNGVYQIHSTKTLKCASGSTQVSGSEVVIIDYSSAGFTSAPRVIANYSTAGNNWEGDGGPVKVFQKTTTGARLIVGGNFPTLRGVDWIAIGV